VCKACRAFNARDPTQKKKCSHCKLSLGLSFFKSFRHYEKAETNTTKKCSMCRSSSIEYYEKNPEKKNIQEWKLCTVPMCVLAVAGVPILGMHRHMQHHRERRELEELDPYPHPIKVQAPSSSIEDEVAEDEMAVYEIAEDPDSVIEDLEVMPADQEQILQILHQSQEEKQLMFSDDHRKNVKALNKSFISMSMFRHFAKNGFH
jgi:hypothetical protein